MKNSKSMNIAFRVDAHPWMGLGHLMRCLTLANQLSMLGAKVHFICRPGPHQYYDRVREQGHALHLLPELDEYIVPEKESQWLMVSQKQDAHETQCLLFTLGAIDWLVVDHYGIDSVWEEQLSKTVNSIAAIDDKPSRIHRCNLLLDQTMGRKESEYVGLLSQSTRLLVGQEYALIGSKYRQLRDAEASCRSQCNGINLLICLGGGDGDNVAIDCIDELQRRGLLLNGKAIQVVVVAANSEYILSESAHKNLDISVLGFVENLEKEMLNADLIIGAPGGATWERCCLGVPSLLIPFAENQRQVAQAMDKSKCALVIERNQITEQLITSLKLLLDDRQGFGKRGKNAVDGLGAARIAQYLIQEQTSDQTLVTLRPANKGDIDRVYQWQLLPEIRRYARNSDVPSRSEHNEWMQSRLNDSNCIFSILYHGEDPSGVIRLDRISAEECEISIYIIPSKFGVGLASSGLKLVDRFVPHMSIRAEVLSENIASHKLFRRSGYASVSEKHYFRKPLIQVSL